MSSNLVIVESPAKAKTIEKYLGPGFQVLASYGHVRDLVPKQGAVDPSNDFAMKYEVIKKNEKHIEAIARAAQKADALYLATDPDREGEAISWHLYEILKERKLLKGKPVHRIVFYEITKRAVGEALEHPKTLSGDLINAQQARRALDYLVGFELSPLLWKKIQRGLSAGRVQSPALRMIVEREIEIENFETQEYWSVEAECQTGESPFKARLLTLRGEKVQQFTLTDEKTATEARQHLLASAGGKLVVSRVEERERKQNPAPPFTTSTLQQEAARKLGFTTKRTMTVAQQLYEGIDLGGETVGLITYMRTDSVNLSADAIDEIRHLIGERYGPDNVPKQPRHYKTKSKNAQEAHEAIRPTSAPRLPDAVKKHLTPDQYRLYNLIWKRTVACQMVHATIKTVSIDLSAGADNAFRATGSTVVHPGFMAVYLEGKDDVQSDEGERLLPPLCEGESVDLLDIRLGQHFTEPPPRYTEASLVKALEEYGIGRPSTYAAIIATLQQRGYAELKDKRFFPTDVGRVVNRFLTEHFNPYVDFHFTARLEDDLDAVSRGEKAWVPLLDAFWHQFKTLVDEKTESVKRRDITQEALDETCPQCGGQLVARLGRNGRFIGCSNYPECTYTRNLGDEEKPEEQAQIVEGRTCPKCGSPLQIKSGRYGKFIGCTAYPRCKYIEPLEKPTDTGVTCPQCGKGRLLQRKSRYGKLFYSCSTYPECQYAVWNPPLAEPCPKCHWPILTLKTTKRRGTEKVCPQKGCGYSEAVEDESGEPTPA